ncbi:6-phosphogluconolactonase [Methylocella sp.]|uniref:6-phosphogluconolactonase n=1 Tax=Methylocella sp. TaxID=1978226 RepID=UPI0035B3EFA6
MSFEPIIDVAEDADDLGARAAAWIAGRIAAAPGRFALCLSGGSTPRDVYARLAAAPLRERVDWSGVHLFWGDERFVPRDDERSNYRMAWDALIARVAIPRQQVHPLDVEAPTPQEAAARYDRLLHEFYGAPRLDPGRPLFDLALLGLGADGHTASLFPGSRALSADERLAVAVEGVMPEARVSLTYRALEASSEIAFLVCGEAKRQALRRVLDGDPSLPASRVLASAATRDAPLGAVRIFADRAAFPI